MSFVIQRTEDGKYVTQPGFLHSYTAKLQEARVFVGREQAERERCGNERVLTLIEAMVSP